MHNRFFCPSENISEKVITINDKKEIHHIVDVLRFGIESDITIFNGEGFEFEGKIKEISKNSIRIMIENKYESKRRPFEITLACAVPKKAKFDFIVEKLTELGVDRIIPLETERSEVRYKKDRMLEKVGHWRQVAINASKQSQRSYIPQIEEVQNFKNVISKLENYDLALFPTLEGERVHLAEALKGFKERRIIIFIGPEGDFSEEEADLARKSGCKLVTLGENVLKVDTAAITVVAVLNSILESKI
ncbi:MAG: 16S rRNA (uracil(1498)-N(3))-methyltransferase [Candidatus Omnitrophica bacterium]|nr:16S rRNA (uracil(1498)-N(3))-methyltransferase [Candidatus Omnitrophota bacterium]HOX54753.1 16S rRNA (uracil(1498)-N(3))-methyltransferase [Candidatus Omnitrophota bacterium]